MEFKKARTTAEFIFYANQISNYIFLRPHGVTSNVRGTFAYFIYEQTDALFLGSDWDIKHSHSKNLSSELKVSYVYAVSTERKQPFLDIPPLNIDYSLDFKKGSWGYGLKLNYTAQQWNAPDAIPPIEINDGDLDIDRNNDIFDFMAPPEDYFLIGGKVSYQKKHWNAEFRVDNLLNTTYRIYTNRLRYFADAPGRNLSFSVQYQF